MMDRLPADVLASILSRLAPRSLATSRAVCRWWRAAVDARGLLRTDHLPLRLGGIFVNLLGPAPSEFFARPSSSPTTRPEISGNLERYVTPLSSHTIMDWAPSVAGSCNGLLLVNKRVVNPATRQWARLPAYPALPDGLHGSADDCQECLVFDPAVSVSPHYYEVLLRLLLMRAHGTYVIIILENQRKGNVYFALVLDSYKLKVWFLDESAGTIQWVLKHDANLKPVVAHFYRPARSDDPTGNFWTVQDQDSDGDDDTERATVDENLGWDSDDDSIHDIQDNGENLEFGYYIATIFGFHPFREVIFLRLGNDRIIAYHLNSSTFKVQDMGECEVESLGKTISEAFVYTPCWIRELFDGNV
ncbi:hypothetical protein EJB05_05159, partial [Eragrostis curvula]